MNTVDIVILCLWIIGFFIGYKRGLIRQAIHLVGFIVAIIIAFAFNSSLADILEKVIPYPFTQTEGLSTLMLLVDVERMFYKAIAFAILFFGTKLLLNIIGHLLTAIASLPGLKQINRLLGGVLGFLQSFIVLFVLVHLLVFIPWQPGQQWVQESSIAFWMTNQTSLVPDLEIWKPNE